MKKKVVKKRNIVLTDEQFNDLVDILVCANRTAKKEEAVEYRNMIYYMKHDIIKYFITDHREKLKIFHCFDNEHRLFHVQINDAIFHVPYGVKYGLKFEDFEEIEYNKEFDKDLSCPYKPEEIFKKLFEYYVYLNKGINNIKSGVIKYWYVNEIFKLHMPDHKVEVKRENGKQSNNPGPNTEYCLFVNDEIRHKEIFSKFWDDCAGEFELHFKNIRDE